MKPILLFITFCFSVNAYAADEQQVVTEANQAWNQAFNEGKIDQLVALYTPEATVSPGNGVILKGKKEIQALFTKFKENGLGNHQIETVDVMADDNQITQIGYWKAKGADADNNEVNYGGALMTVLQKNAAGEWQMQSHVWNMAP